VRKVDTLAALFGLVLEVRAHLSNWAALNKVGTDKEQSGMHRSQAESGPNHDSIVSTHHHGQPSSSPSTDRPVGH
jgi:hypothetical protein